MAAPVVAISSHLLTSSAFRSRLYCRFILHVGLAVTTPGVLLHLGKASAELTLSLDRMVCRTTPMYDVMRRPEWMGRRSLGIEETRSSD
jgi:hypothetical protein